MAMALALRWEVYLDVASEVAGAVEGCGTAITVLTSRLKDISMVTLTASAFGKL
jgi:hypothetical protein